MGESEGVKFPLQIFVGRDFDEWVLRFLTLFGNFGTLDRTARRILNDFFSLNHTG